MVLKQLETRPWTNDVFLLVFMILNFFVMTFV